MKVLDLFCCGGGAARGYLRAGCEVFGVDIEMQPGYPAPMEVADALVYVREHGHRFDFIHASPPCQGYSPHVTTSSSQYSLTKGKDEPRLIEPLRDILQQLGVPYSLENVAGARAHLINPAVLCGSMFGLPTPRHRLFETDWGLTVPPHPKCRGIAKAFAAERGWEYRDMSVTGKGRRAGTADRWKEILGIEPEAQLTQGQLAESIPPAYTEFIARQFIGRFAS